MDSAKDDMLNDDMKMKVLDRLIEDFKVDF